MRQINSGGILHQQHHRRGGSLFFALVQMRLHQGIKGDIGLRPRKRYNAFVPFQVRI